MLRITEVFYSIQGEARHTGKPTVFIRLTGCPMRCVYCDSAYAFHGGQKISVAEISEQIKQYNTRYITVTGGEPLAQKSCFQLLSNLCDQGYEVSLETGNAVDIAMVDKRVNVVLDIKTPASGEERNNNYDNLHHLKQDDQLKFVILDKPDYEWSKQFMKENQLDQRCEVIFSPVADKLEAVDLASWVLEDQLPVRMQIQLHKYLWGDKPGV